MIKIDIDAQAFAPLFIIFVGVSFHLPLSTNAIILKPVLLEFLGIVYVATVDDKRLLHRLIHYTPARQTELLPLGEHEQGIGVEHGVVHISGVINLVTDATTTLVHCHGIVNADGAAGFEQEVDGDEDVASRISSVSGLNAKPHIAMVFPLRSPP